MTMESEVLAEFELEETYIKGVYEDLNDNVFRVGRQNRNKIPEHTGGLVAKVQLIKRTEEEN